MVTKTVLVGVSCTCFMASVLNKSFVAFLSARFCCMYSNITQGTAICTSSYLLTFLSSFTACFLALFSSLDSSFRRIMVPVSAKGCPQNVAI